MILLGSGIVCVSVLVCKHIEEIVKENVDTNHVSDIEVTCQRERKEDNEYLIFSVLDELLNTVGDQGQPHYAVDPHRVVLMNYTISGESIEN